MRLRYLAATALLLLGTQASAEKLTIGTSADFPPWESVNESGEIVGFDRQVGDEICSRIDAQCVWINQSYDGLLPSLSIGKFDLVISGISINAEREKKVDFSIAYADAPNNFIVPNSSSIAKDASKAELLKALAGKSIGVQAGTTHEQTVNAHIPSAKVRVYDRPEQILADIRAQRIDAGLSERSVWDSLLSKNASDVTFAGPLLSGADFSELGRGQGVVLSKGNSSLKARIDNAIQAMISDGTMTQFSEQAFGYDLSVK